MKMAGPATIPVTLLLCLYAVSFNGTAQAGSDNNEAETPSNINKRDIGGCLGNLLCCFSTCDSVNITTNGEYPTDAFGPASAGIWFGDPTLQSDKVTYIKVPPLKTQTIYTTSTPKVGVVDRIAVEPYLNWRPELISLTHGDPKVTSHFPIDRRLTPFVKKEFGLYDAFLPFNDPFLKQRKEEIKANREVYEYGIVYQDAFTKTIGVKNMPPDENFSLNYALKLGLTSGTTVVFTALRKFDLRNEEWESYDDMKKMYNNFNITAPPRYATDDFKTDEWFGKQRTQGINPGILIRINIIPSNFRVTNEMVKSRLEGQTLEEALKRDKIFLVDYKVMKDIRKDLNVECPAPLGLFYLNSTEHLLPIAIQLLQEPGDDNPVFTPDDDKQTWLLAKLYFNLADSSHHQGITHLGNMHYMMERIIIAARRNMSPSHPIFRLMKPHFLYTFAINRIATSSMKDPKGSTGQTLTVGGPGILYLTSVGLRHYNMSLDGNVHELFKVQGTTSDYLVDYPYRDDIIKSYDIVRKYVKKIVKAYYPNPDDLTNDYEIQEWRKELGRSCDNLDGAEIKGVPGSDTDGFTDLDELIDTATAIIHTASCRHAAINFLQYDYYAFPPNSPWYLKGPIPTKKDPVSEKYVLGQFPLKNKLTDEILFTRLLSTKATNLLGNFEVPTLYDPKVTDNVDKFRRKVDDQSKRIHFLNEAREIFYDWGDPSLAPNAISI